MEVGTAGCQRMVDVCLAVGIHQTASPAEWLEQGRTVHFVLLDQFDFVGAQSLMQLLVYNYCN